MRKITYTDKHGNNLNLSFTNGTISIETPDDLLVEYTLSSADFRYLINDLQEVAVKLSLKESVKKFRENN